MEDGLPHEHRTFNRILSSFPEPRKKQRVN